MYVEEKAQLYSLNISEVIQSKNYCYLKARKILFQNTLQESTCSRVLNASEMNMGALSSEFSIDPTLIEVGEISLSEI